MKKGVIVFGLGKKKSKPRFTLDQPSEAVSNVLFLLAENKPNTAISISLHKGDGTFLDFSISMLGLMVDDELFDTMNATYNRLTNVDNPTAIRDAIVIYNDNMAEARRIYNIILPLSSKYYLNTIGAIVSDGEVWEDMVLGNTGTVDRSVFTDYQAYNLSNGEQLKPYDPLN